MVPFRSDFPTRAATPYHCNLQLLWVFNGPAGGWKKMHMFRLGSYEIQWGKTRNRKRQTSFCSTPWFVHDSWLQIPKMIHRNNRRFPPTHSDSESVNRIEFPWFLGAHQPPFCLSNDLGWGSLKPSFFHTGKRNLLVGNRPPFFIRTLKANNARGTRRGSARKQRKATFSRGCWGGN